MEDIAIQDSIWNLGKISPIIGIAAELGALKYPLFCGEVMICVLNAAAGLSAISFAKKHRAVAYWK
jgi:hypothetical protein